MTTNGADGTSAGPKDDKAAELELLKQQAEFLRLGYTRCTIRYNEIYASVWSIFSFLAAGTGAFLGFAKGNVGTWLLVGVPVGVVWFWYLVVFAPLNRYGNNVSKEAARLEKAINEAFFVKAASPGLRMFRDFEDRKGPSNGSGEPKGRVAKFLGRVRAPLRKVVSSRVENRLRIAILLGTAAALLLGGFGLLERPVDSGPTKHIVEGTVVTLGVGSGK